MKTIEVTKPGDAWLKYKIVTESEDDIKALEGVKQKYGKRACHCEGHPTVMLYSDQDQYATHKIKKDHAECVECDGIVWVY